MKNKEIETLTNKAYAALQKGSRALHDYKLHSCFVGVGEQYAEQSLKEIEAVAETLKDCVAKLREVKR